MDIRMVVESKCYKSENHNPLDGELMNGLSWEEKMKV